ncbi:hypothetical protein AYI69_g6234 [Smittium culicis]|uniref:Uncharacterized protein n=1 Tax=Smittium culicis TaxID=133412 RepID=A0A1R1Y0A3_9FUNG|nr:hypothetical protein AYI69_g6234 [Smittium culicis]
MKFSGILLIGLLVEHVYSNGLRVNRDSFERKIESSSNGNIYVRSGKLFRLGSRIKRNVIRSVKRRQDNSGVGGSVYNSDQNAAAADVGDFDASDPKNTNVPNQNSADYSQVDPGSISYSQDDPDSSNYSQDDLGDANIDQVVPNSNSYGQADPETANIDQVDTNANSYSQADPEIANVDQVDTNANSYNQADPGTANIDQVSPSNNSYNQSDQNSNGYNQDDSGVANIDIADTNDNNYAQSEPISDNYNQVDLDSVNNSQVDQNSNNYVQASADSVNISQINPNSNGYAQVDSNSNSYAELNQKSVNYNQVDSNVGKYTSGGSQQQLYKINTGYIGDINGLFNGRVHENGKHRYIKMKLKEKNVSSRQTRKLEPYESKILKKRTRLVPNPKRTHKKSNKRSIRHKDSRNNIASKRLVHTKEKILAIPNLKNLGRVNAKRSVKLGNNRILKKNVIRPSKAMKRNIPKAGIRQPLTKKSRKLVSKRVKKNMVQKRTKPTFDLSKWINNGKSILSKKLSKPLNLKNKRRFVPKKSVGINLNDKRQVNDYRNNINAGPFVSSGNKNNAGSRNFRANQNVNNNANISSNNNANSNNNFMNIKSNPSRNGNNFNNGRINGVRGWNFNSQSDRNFVSGIRIRPTVFSGRRFEFVYKNASSFRRSWNSSLKFRNSWNRSASFRSYWFNRVYASVTKFNSR